MTKPHRRTLLFGASSLLLAGHARAGGPRASSTRIFAAGDRPIDETLARIARAREPMRTLQGPFVQTRNIGLLATAVRSTGNLTLVRPDRLRWDLAPPDAITFWITPEGLAYRSAHGAGRLSAATAGGTGGTRISGALDDLRTLLGGDLTRLRERWDLRILRDDVSGAEIEATPHPGTAGPLYAMHFALTPDLVRPARVVLAEGPRDKTLIEFGTLTVNAPVDLSRMQLPR